MLKLGGAVGIIALLTSGYLGVGSIRIEFVTDDDDEDYDEDVEEEESSIINQLPGHHSRQGNLHGGEDDEHGHEQDDHDDPKGELISFIVWSAPKKLPREYYSSSDPEWQEFAKLSKNAEKIKNLKCELLMQLPRLLFALKSHFFLIPFLSDSGPCESSANYYRQRITNSNLGQGPDSGRPVVVGNCVSIRAASDV